MRKILLIIIIVLLLILGYGAAGNGIQIGSFQILSIKQIEQESQNLKAKIEESNKLIDTDYPKKVSDLQVAKNSLQQAKDEYVKYTNLSSAEDVLEAKTEKTYAIEFLWTKLGLHAREEGVNITFELVSSSTGANNVNDVKFTVNGSYIAITNFVYAIENDTDLDFRIKDFKLLPYKNEILQGTFKVENIAVEGNTSKQTTKETNDSDKKTDTNSNTNTTVDNNSSSSTTNTVKHPI